MYTAHFGLRELPFAITPDPRYLYMSERHREALAHLLYGVSAGGGFVQLTGEVGTGKTTVCRCLLEQLPPNVDAALILNPRLTASELLATVCDELRIPYPPRTTSLKLLVDALSSHLLQAHAQGRRTVLIIDEAQNLSLEVLEQVRLLTNLETTQEKLLQVILIGQPELIQRLNRPRLRQLAQRVTARYHLLPLSQQETRAYISHRLVVAGQTATLFTSAAVREVHRVSGGVPRLINVMCDRALLGVFARDKKYVDAMTVRRAAAEVLGRVTWSRTARSLLRVSALAAGGAAIVVAAVLATQAPLEDILRSGRFGTYSGATPLNPATPNAAHSSAPMAKTLLAASNDTLPGLKTRDESHRDTEGVRPRAGGSEEPGATTTAVAVADKAKAATLAEALSDPSLRSDMASAFASLASFWAVDSPRTKGSPDCERVRAAGLECLFRTGTWSKLLRYRLPAIMELETPAGDRHYAMVTAAGRERATLDLGGRQFTAPVSEIELSWDGSFILLWKPPPLSKMPISPGTRGKDVEWLRERLSALDGQSLVGTDRGFYDDQLKERVKAFQRSRSLRPDGIVGEETLIHLTQSGIPVLSSP